MVRAKDFHKKEATLKVGAKQGRDRRRRRLRRVRLCPRAPSACAHSRPGPAPPPAQPLQQQLRRKAEERNPDEFYFGMEKAGTKEGVHIAPTAEANKYRCAVMRCAAPRCAAPRCAALCRAVPRCDVPSHAMLRSAVLCYDVS